MHDRRHALWPGVPSVNVVHGGRRAGRRTAVWLVGVFCLLCEGLAVWGRARASAATLASADISVTIVAPLPAVSVLEVMPPAISTSGAVLIHMSATDWVSLPVAEGAGAVQSSVTAAATSSASANGTLRDGLAVSVSGRSPASGMATESGPVRVLVEFN